MKIENGKKYIFNTTDTELTKYNGAEVEIIRPLTEDEADIFDVGNMYKVRFANGYERDAFEDKLSRQKHKFMEYIIEDVTEEEIIILEREGIEWYPDDLNGRDIIIDGDENYYEMALHAIRMRGKRA